MLYKWFIKFFVGIFLVWIMNSCSYHAEFVLDGYFDCEEYSEGGF